MKQKIESAIKAIAERAGTSILGISYVHPVKGLKEYNLRTGDSRTKPLPHGANPFNKVSHVSGNGNTLLRVIDHNGGETPKTFDINRIISIRCGNIRV